MKRNAAKSDRAQSPKTPPERWFVKELPGETPPSLSTMEHLYDLTSQVYGLRPWQWLAEDQLILARDPATGELCYCSVMGALGEVFSVHAYIGTEGYRMFRKIQAEELAGAGEFFGSMRSVSVEFVAKTDTDALDRKLLAAFHHPTGKEIASPIFRSIRPGFYPWFVNEQEAQTLAVCMHATLRICTAVMSQRGLSFWDDADTFPLVAPVEGEHPSRIQSIKAILPAEPPVAAVRSDDERFLALRHQDYAVRGVLELDHIYTPTIVGKKNERKACICITLAVDADSGFVYSPEMTHANISPGEAMAKAFLKAVQASRTMPKEVRVRSGRLKDSVAPLLESFGITIRVAKQLPALEQAQAALLRMMEGG